MVFETSTQAFPPDQRQGSSLLSGRCRMMGMLKNQIRDKVRVGSMCFYVWCSLQRLGLLSIPSGLSR